VVPPVLQTPDFQRRVSARVQPAERHAGGYDGPRRRSHHGEGAGVRGVEYEADCIIFATGFEVGTAYTRRAAFDVYGRGGKALSENWATGMKTLHGFCSVGFPNCFHMGITQNALTANFPHMLEEQSRHIAELIKHAKSQEARCIEPTAEAEAEWVATIKEKAMNNQDFLEACTPGYYNNEGKPEKASAWRRTIRGGPSSSTS